MVSRKLKTMITEDPTKIANKPSKTLLGLFWTLIAFIIVWYISTPLVLFIFYIVKSTPLVGYSVFDLAKAILLLLIVVAVSIAILVLTSKEKLERLLKLFLMITSASAIVSRISTIPLTDIISGLFIKWIGEDFWFGYGVFYGVFGLSNFFSFLNIVCLIAFWVGVIGSIVLFIKKRSKV